MGIKPIIIILLFTEPFSINWAPCTRHASDAMDAKSEMWTLLLKGLPGVCSEAVVAVRGHCNRDPFTVTRGMDVVQ